VNKLTDVINVMDHINTRVVSKSKHFMLHQMTKCTKLTWTESIVYSLFTARWQHTIKTYNTIQYKVVKLLKKVQIICK